MSTRIRHRSRKAGLPPGSLIHVGERVVDEVRITCLDYTADTLTERSCTAPEECFPFRDSASVSWINVEGVHDPALIERLGTHFRIHPLALEDILNTTQRPMVQDYDGYLFITLRMLCRRDRGAILSEQVSFILGPSWVISFQEGFQGDVFDPVRARIRSAKGRVRTMGADYLAYALIDAVIDSYFGVLESLGEELERIEESLTNDPHERLLRRIYQAKRSSIFMRRAVWPLRELVGALERGESPLISPPVRVFLRDVYTHAIEVIDILEAHREMVAGLLEIYLSSVSNKLNRVMMVLTLITSIFMPLSFIAGIYGMNFEYMPELKEPWGYPIALVFMLAIAAGMILVFRRKGWL